MNGFTLGKRYYTPNGRRGMLIGGRKVRALLRDSEGPFYCDWRWLTEKKPEIDLKRLDELRQQRERDRRSRARKHEREIAAIYAEAGTC